jgi:site-specific recombinase XerD
MTPLRRDFLTRLRVRHCSPRTIERYEKIVEELAYFHRRTPLGMNAQHIRSFLMDRVKVHKFAPASTNQYISALRQFYRMMEPDNRVMEGFNKLRVHRKLPQILDRSELRAIFSHTHNIKHRAALVLMYSSGVRLGECVRLRPCHIERGRMMLRVECGKGGKDRYTILSYRALALLEDYFRTCRPSQWLFEGRGRRGMHLHTSTIVKALQAAASQARITKRVYPHILRHCFATHLLEQGTPLSFIQRCLGHKQAKTTSTYAHVTEAMRAKVRSPLDVLYEEGTHV